MASNMTKAFQAKAKRALGCRPGYAGGGTTEVFKTGSNSFGDQGAAPLAMGSLGGATAPSPAAPAVGTGQSLGQSAPGIAGEGSMIFNGPLKSQGSTSLSAFADTPQGNIAMAKAKMMENGMSEATYGQFHSPDAKLQQDAAAKVQDKMRTATSRELDMLAGHDPHASFKYDQGGNKVYDNETGETRASMRAQGMSSLGFAGNPRAAGALGGGMATSEMQAALKRQVGAQLGQQSQSSLWGYADGGAVAKPEDPVEALLRRTSQTYGVSASQPAPPPRPVAQPAPQPAPQPQTRSLGDVLRQRSDELKRVTNYADGGTVRQFEFQGAGGPREDKIPVRFAGADIRVSDGERGVILPAKTAANPNAVDAIEDIIQGTNDGRSPRRGLGDGGHYADGLDQRTAQGAYENGKWSPEATQFRAERRLSESTPSAAAPATPAQPQNIAPEIQMSAEPAPVAEPQVRRGLFSRIPGAIKGGAQTVADATVKVLGGTPGAQQPTAQPAVPVEKSPTPITDRAQALGQSLGKGEIPGLVKVDAQGNRYLTKGGGAGMGAGAALQFGDHFDAYDTREGGLSHGQRAQLFARDLGVLAGGTAGAVGGGVAGSFVTPVAGTIAGGIGGGIGGAVYADKGMGKVRQGINWVNEKLGGAPNYFEDSDAMIARDRANRDALGIEEGAAQGAVRPVNSAIGAVMQSAGLVSRGGEPAQAGPDTSNHSNEGRGQERIDLSQVEPINRGGRAQARGVDNELAVPTKETIEGRAHTGNAGNVTVSDGNMIRFQADKGFDPTKYKFAPGTGVATVTGAAADGGRMMPGVKQNKLGTSIFIGPGDYLAKDGSRTSDWTKTADYEGGLRRAEQNRIDLGQVMADRQGRDPMASRMLGQSMQPPGEDAATDMSSLDAGRASVARNLTSPNSGTRALAAHQQHVLDTMVAQHQANVKMGYEMRVKGAEMANADKASARSDAEAYDKHLATIFRNPKGGKDGNEDVPDTQAIADFKRMAAYTTAKQLEEAQTPEQIARWTSKATGKARDVAELDAADHAKMVQQFKVRQRHLATMGNFWGDSDVGDSQRLDHWTPHITPNGDEVYFPKMLKNGRALRGKTKQYAYTRPIGWKDLTALQTPTNDILADAIHDK